MRFLCGRATRATDCLSLGYPSSACALLVSLETVARLRAARLGEERPGVSGLGGEAVLLSSPEAVQASFGNGVSGSV